jgi:membrane protein required for colicin V production
MGNLNIVDILILVIVFGSVIVGFGRGLVSELLSLITVIAAFVVAIMYTTALANFFTTSAPVQSVVSQTSSAIGTSTATPVSYLAYGASFAALFVGTMIVGSIIKWILNLIFSTGILGFGNRILGGVFGFVRGFLIVVGIIFVVQLSPVSKQTFWQQSQLVPQFQPAVVWLGGVVNPALANIKSTFGSTVQSVTGSVSGAVSGAVEKISK